MKIFKYYLVSLIKIIILTELNNYRNWSKLNNITLI
jgi:hypothetical protein